MYRFSHPHIMHTEETCPWPPLLFMLQTVPDNHVHHKLLGSAVVRSVDSITCKIRSSDASVYSSCVMTYTR